MNTDFLNTNPSGEGRKKGGQGSGMRRCPRAGGLSCPDNPISEPWLRLLGWVLCTLGYETMRPHSHRCLLLNCSSQSASKPYRNPAPSAHAISLNRGESPALSRPRRLSPHHPHAAHPASPSRGAREEGLRPGISVLFPVSSFGASLKASHLLMPPYTAVGRKTDILSLTLSMLNNNSTMGLEF